MMWNWYVTNHGGQFTALANLGELIEINTSHDSIYFELPAGVLAYEVQIQHTPENITFGSLDSDGSVNASETDLEQGVFNLINVPGEKKQVCPTNRY